MTDLIDIDSFEYKVSKNGCKIPYINGVHLHSLYNPQKESITIINKYSEAIKDKNIILLFGLGLGFHLDELESRLQNYHNNEYEVMVIEPLEELVKSYQDERSKESKKIKIISERDIRKIYKNKEFLNFLIKKPLLIYHPASFNLFRKYYESIVTFKAPQKISECLDEVLNEKIRNDFSNFPKDKTLVEIGPWLERQNNHVFNKTELLVLAFNEFYK